MIRITQGGIQVSRGGLNQLRADYQEKGLAVIPGFLTPEVLNPLLRKLATGEFQLMAETAVKGSTLLMPSTDPTLISLHFMLNRTELFAAVSQITGLPAPANFTSRLHRTLPEPGLHLDWHDDGVDFRILGLNINLSTTPYEGGILEVRNPEGKTVGKAGQMSPGDAFLFRIGERWQHRLTPVEAGERTVAVGWFRTIPDWSTVILAGLRAAISLERDV